MQTLIALTVLLMLFFIVGGMYRYFVQRIRPKYMLLSIILMIVITIFCSSYFLSQYITLPQVYSTLTRIRQEATSSSLWCELMVEGICIESYSTVVSTLSTHRYRSSKVEDW
jgi:hypothetical protein